MHKYKSPAQASAATTTGDQRGSFRRLFDSTFARSLRVISILLGVYAPVAILLGVLLLFGGIDATNQDEDEARSARRTIALIAGGIGVSGVAAGYMSYRTWGMTDRVRRSNRRRAKGLD